MTLPNRDGYAPGARRRARPSAVTAGEETAPTSRRVDPEELRPLLDAIAPLEGKGSMQGLLQPLAGALEGVEAVAHRKELADAARRRLEEDPVFAANKDLMQLLSLPSLLDGGKVEADGYDELEEVVEQLPAPRRGVADLEVDVGLCADSLSGILLDEGGIFATDLERTKRQLREWGTRQVSLLTERVPTSPEASSKMYSSNTGLSPMLASYGLDLSGAYGPPKRRANLSKATKEVLRIWFEEHVHHPYPTESEKERLAQKGGITIEQVNNWFINTRGRKWKPMLKRLMAEKQNGGCRLLDEMVQRITEPYERDLE